MLIAREVFNSIGLFDTSMEVGGCDIDLVKRARGSGIIVSISPDAKVHHVIPPYRVTSRYFRWTSMRWGNIFAYVDCKNSGRAKMLFFFVARIGQVVFVNFPLLIFSVLTRNSAQSLDRKCLLWRAIGYTCGTASLAVPGLFKQALFPSRLEFRKREQPSPSPKRCAGQSLRRDDSFAYGNLRASREMSQGSRQSGYLAWLIGEPVRQITVGIPLFNAMPYLPESLESVLRQSHSDFEILVINDGSTDGGRDYLRSIRDPRLRVVDQENRGVAAARKRMLAEASTPWLALLDADDVAYPHRLARAVDYISQYPGSGMFYSLADYYPAASVGRYRTTKGSPGELRDLVQSGYLLAICNSTAILNVERARAVGGYRFDLYAVEDTDLWWRMALHYDIRFIPEVLTGYRQNQQGLSSLNLGEQALSTFYVQYLLISHLWKRNPLAYEEARSSLLRLFNSRKVKFRNHLRAFNMGLGRGDKNAAFVQCRQGGFHVPDEFHAPVVG